MVAELHETTCRFLRALQVKTRRDIAVPFFRLRLRVQLSRKVKCASFNNLWFREQTHTEDSRREGRVAIPMVSRTNSYGRLQGREASRQCLGESPMFHCEFVRRAVQQILGRRAVMAPHADRRDSVGESPDSMRHHRAMSETLIRRGGSAPSWPAQGGIVGERPCTRAFGLIALTPRRKSVHSVYATLSRHVTSRYVRLS
jgi:hypothetical protein